MRFRISVIFGAAICLATLLLLYQLVSLPPDTNSAVPNQVSKCLTQAHCHVVNLVLCYIDTVL